ncbi:MAG: TFIIE alpha subunit [Methanocella sp. PtaU1.Bin125]|nr:MAG: TFIIE alpha subunit [Methanocella sp. PtaU1.Bin125]
MARIIVCLAVHDDCTSREIEIVTGIKSSTVSIILKKLREDRIVRGEKKAEKPHDRGVMHYTLAGSMDDVLSILEEKKKKETSAYIDRIKKIKSRLK